MPSTKEVMEDMSREEIEGLLACFASCLRDVLIPADALIQDLEESRPSHPIHKNKNLKKLKVGVTKANKWLEGK